jgi:hypothetical protein
MSEAQLVRAIKAHIERGDKAKDKADQHYVAAGLRLKELKESHGGTWTEWEELLKTKIGIGKSRASELMQIADGRKTLVEVREAGAARIREHRESSPLRNGEAPAAASKAIMVPPESVPTPRDVLLEMAGTGAGLAKEWHSADIENDAELAATARKVADAWGVVADALDDEEPDEDEEPHIGGAIKKLVDRQKRFKRNAKKQEAALEEHRRAYGPEYAALAAQLVELDRNVARNVLRSIALFGPCGYVEMPNFLDGGVLARAIQKALGNEPQFAVEDQGAAADDGLDIPESLRRTA